VIGSRDRKQINRLHRFGNWVISRTFSVLFGVKVTDVCSGMYLLETDQAKKFNVEEHGFVAEIELAAQSAALGTITEVPISFRLRIGKEKLKAFVASFSANLITGLLNIIYLFIFWQDVSIYTRKAVVMTVALLINILLEALVLKLFYKTINNRKILGVSTLMNLASYGILLLLA
jgi:dolichol-phosphate mannosyltransferase